MKDPTAASSVSGQTPDAHGDTPCACQQQSMGALPWMVAVLLALLVLQYVRARKSRGGAAIASNCEPCFKFHYDKARKLGVSREDMLRAATVAQNVKDAPARSMIDMAQRYLSRDAELEQALSGPLEKVSASSCCGDGPVRLGTKKGGCC